MTRNRGLDREAKSTARYYKTLRSAHLERSVTASDGQITFYAELSYDLRPSIVEARNDVVRCSPWKLAKELTRREVSVLEVNEPVMVAGWKFLVPILMATHRMRAKGELELVAYAIGNLTAEEQIFAKVGMHSRLLGIASRYVARQCMSRLSRLAFGTSAAERLYGELHPELTKRIGRKFTAMPARRGGALAPQKVPNRLVFVGSFEQRKGIDTLMEAWPAVAASVEGSSIRVIGKGPLLQIVKEWCSRTESAALILDPPRDVIRDELEAASVLVLLSQRVPGWREQIGLPILEGLSHGCTIVTTDETGIAAELHEAGHTVLPYSASVDRIARALAEALKSPLRPDVVLEALPAVDGRLLAHDWLMGGEIPRL